MNMRKKLEPTRSGTVAGKAFHEDKIPLAIDGRPVEACKMAEKQIRFASNMGGGGREE